MRNLFKALIIPILMLSVFAVSCVSTAAASGAAAAEPAAEKHAAASNAAGADSPSAEIPRFTDWEYRGFGREIPAWTGVAVDGGESAVQQNCPEYAGKHIVILSAAGANSDQAAHVMAKVHKNRKDIAGCALADSIWVTLSRKTDIEKFGGSCLLLCLYIQK